MPYSGLYQSFVGAGPRPALYKIRKVSPPGPWVYHVPFMPRLPSAAADGSWFKPFRGYLLYKIRMMGFFCETHSLSGEALNSLGDKPYTCLKLLERW